MLYDLAARAQAIRSWNNNKNSGLPKLLCWSHAWSIAGYFLLKLLPLLTVVKACQVGQKNLGNEFLKMSRLFLKVICGKK
jgi:hypothetical protein